MKRDLKTIITLIFTATGVYLTVAGILDPQIAFVPVYLSVFAYYFNKKDTPPTPTSSNTTTTTTTDTQIDTSSNNVL